jgi:cytochrome oxidase assembly protein ShyY1
MVTGRYDRDNEILARGRTVSGSVGFEIITPLVRDDGTAVLVDRGWVAPPTSAGAAALPDVPPAPDGEVTVVGRVHAAESRATVPTRSTGPWEVRRISPARIGQVLPYALASAYVTMDSQTPPATGFVALTPEHENAPLNAGYMVQWWLFAALTIVGYGYLARREAQSRAELDRTVDRLLDDEVTGPPANAPVSPAV